MCGRWLYREESTGDPVCVRCCGVNIGDNYVTLRTEESK
jgi:hypothetical protein